MVLDRINQNLTEPQPDNRGATPTSSTVGAPRPGAAIIGGKMPKTTTKMEDLVANLADELRSTQNQARRERGERYILSDTLAAEVMRVAAGTPARAQAGAQ